MRDTPRILWILALGLSVLAAGCETTPDDPDSGPGSGPGRSGKAAATRTDSLETGAEGYFLELTLPARARSNAPLELGVRVHDFADRAAPLDLVSLAVTARPVGKNVPVVNGSVAGAAGVFRVAGLSLPSSGIWEIYFDVTRGALTERGQIELPVR